MVNTQEFVLLTSTFEEPWFRREVEQNQELQDKINENVRFIQQVCSRDWTNEVKVVLKNDTVVQTHSNEIHSCSIAIYVYFQRGYRSYIKHTFDVEINI